MDFAARYVGIQWVNNLPKMKHMETRELGAAIIIGVYMGPNRVYMYIVYMYMCVYVVWW